MQSQWADWQIEQDRLDTLAAIAGRAVRSRGGIDHGIMLKAGESALCAADGQLIEPRRHRGYYTGRSSGVSVRISRGVWYRASGYRGRYVPGPELQTPVDVGRAVITTARVVFTGTKTTREWRFDKLVSVDSDATTVLLHVANRQKVSGVVLGSGDAENFQTGLELALMMTEHGVDVVAGQLRTIADEHMRSRPRPPSAH
ncbi:hypothetical protein [Nocardia neocaledoniensis]|uniref:hypothetical protein n=1 Tax=Nocardia neocaledoniensis TaxID=236511 RepID=UPI00245896D4|nr:hypothetical protein [Nocardia neocaledoniensis]